MKSNQRPARRRESAIIEASELAKLTKLREDELQQVASRSQIPFSWSTLGGLYIRRDDLQLWKSAANAYRRNRERADESVFYP